MFDTTQILAHLCRLKHTNMARIVFKVGSSSLVSEDGNLDLKTMVSIVEMTSALRKAGSLHYTHYTSNIYI